MPLPPYRSSSDDIPRLSLAGAGKSVSRATAMGAWCVLVAAFALANSRPATSLLCFVFAGVLSLVGSIVSLKDRPRPWTGSGAVANYCALAVVLILTLLLLVFRHK